MLKIRIINLLFVCSFILLISAGTGTANEKLSSDLKILINSTSSNIFVDSEPIQAEQIHVYITMNENNFQSIIPFINKLSYWDNEKYVADAWVDIDKLDELSDVNNVKSIRSVQGPIINSQPVQKRNGLLELINFIFLIR